MTRRRATTGAVACGSLPPPEWSIAHMFYTHGELLFDMCPEDLPVKAFKAGKDRYKEDTLKPLLDEARSGRCRAYPIPLFFRVDFYERDRWGRLAKNHYLVDSLTLAKLYCGAAKTLALAHGRDTGASKGRSRGGATYYHFILLRERVERERFDAILEELKVERRRIGPAATTALKRLYLSRLYSGKLWEVVVAKTNNRANLVAMERLALYDLSPYEKLKEALDASAKYLGDEDAHELAVEIAESLETYFETGRVEHLYDTLRVLHGHARRADCDASCRYARVLLPGIREVVVGKRSWQGR